MALVTGQRNVSASQCKLGQFVVIKIRFLPVQRVVTGFTLVTVVAFVRIVLFVATDTSRRNVAIVVGFGVTGHATSCPVLVQQRKLRARMIKGRDSPVLCRGVAGLAVRSQCAFVFVVRLVATDARRWCILEIGGLRMASLAFGVYVSAVKLEPCS